MSVNFNWIDYRSLHLDGVNIKKFNDMVYYHFNQQNHVPTEFDWIAYKSLNPDLSHIACYQDAIKHYKNHGRKESRPYSFTNKPNDEKYYFHQIEKGLLNSNAHQLEGFHESTYQFFNKNHELPLDFDWITYRTMNPDLTQIKCYTDAAKHYKEYGHKEGRPYISNLTPPKTITSQLPNDFDWKNYVSMNSDLSHIRNYEDAIKHYKDHGYKEKRPYKHVISKLEPIKKEIPPPSIKKNNTIKKNEHATPLKNKINYDDLISVPATPILLHRSDNKKPQIPHNFDWIAYKSMNPDLTHISSHAEAIRHYLGHGRKEHRSYSFPQKSTAIPATSLSPQKDIQYLDLPLDFNWVEYKSLHPDLKNIDDHLHICKHYIEHGKRENRKYTETPGLNKRSVNAPKSPIKLALKSPSIPKLIFETPQKSNQIDESDLSPKSKQTPIPIPATPVIKSIHETPYIRFNSPKSNSKTPKYTPKYSPKKTDSNEVQATPINLITEQIPVPPTVSLPVPPTESSNPEIKVIRRQLDSIHPKIVTSTKPSDIPIPNIIHFVYGFKPQDTEFSLFKYIAIESAIKLNKPNCVYFHYKYEPHGYWWDLIKPCLKMNHIDPPKMIFDKPVTKFAHQADIIRLKMLNEMGGIYLDIDTICLKPFKDFMKYDFVMGLQGDNYGLCNAIMLAKPNTTFGHEWYQSYHNFDENLWDYHSVQLPLILSKKIPITILENDTFFYPLWDPLKECLFNERIDLNEAQKIFKNSYCIHLWESYNENELNQITMSNIFSKNTLYNILARKFIKNKFSIVMLTHNRPDKTIECINSFLSCINREDIEEFLIYDNASDDFKLLAYLKNLPNINPKFKIIFSSENLGVSGGRAVLFEKAKANIICSFDSDLSLINQNFFDTLKHHLYDESIGMIGVSGAYFSKTFEFGSHKDIVDSERVRIVDTLAGCCQVFRKDLKYLGIKMDTNYGKFWVEDSDFCFQIRRTNKKMLIIPQKSYVNHIWGGTGNAFGDLFSNNWKYFTQKWINHKEYCSI